MGSAITDPLSRIRPVGPWFHDRPRWAAGVAGVLFGGIVLVGAVFGEDRPLFAVALVLPVALLAVAFGRRGGIPGGLAAVALDAAWFTRSHTGGMGAAGWTGALSVLLLGVLLGEAVEGVAESQRQLRQAEEVACRHRQASEINDVIVQGIAVAKWALEAGDVDRALAILDETVGEGQRLVSALLADPG